MYPDAAAKITRLVGEWTQVQSGAVTGYVYSQYILVGNAINSQKGIGYLPATYTSILTVRRLL